MLPDSSEALMTLRKSQDGNTDEFIIFCVLKLRFCVTSVKYYDYIVKCGVACDRCASLDI